MMQSIVRSAQAAALTLFLAVGPGAGPALSESGPPAQKTWFIAAANPYAVDAGAEILAAGGSAVDAAIATQAVLGLVEPQSSGLGGGGFLLHYDPSTRRLETYDGREVAPASARPDRFIDANGKPMDFMTAVDSGLSIGVPGVVRMLELAHREHGVKSWSTLWSPAEKLATDGFRVSPRLNRLITENIQLKDTPAARAYFFDKSGAPLAVGATLKNPAYAEALRAIAAGGADAFYTGKIAEAIVTTVNAAPKPGGMTLADLAGYAPVKREAVCGAYRALKVCSMAPPSSGGVTLLEMLAMLESFRLDKMKPESVESLHLIFEAGKLAYADRNQFLSDKDRSGEKGGLTQDEVISGLLDRRYLKARARLIDPRRAADAVKAGDPGAFVRDKAVAAKWRALSADASGDGSSTSHFVIVDGEGRVVSMTTTVEFTFGSQQMAMGMVLNNQLTDFSFVPEREGVPVANAVAPGKRPRSSMTPVVIFDRKGAVWGALGSPGGPAIMGYVAKTLIGLLDWKLSMQAAIDLPNAVIPRGSPVLERGRFDAADVDRLKQLGHAVSERELNSGVHGVRLLPGGGFDGGADRRREGTVRTGAVVGSER